ncbi:hypothetical protein V6U77_18010 [Micromonospora sp. CPCC 205546]|uniref:hypothetical protein n=1 Tax=Micromonospora sp. CPCC 205546 TaxID=3122397 RepID=UPI002FF17E7F
MASTLGCGTIVGLTSAPATAAAGAPIDLRTAGQSCATAAPGPYLSPVRLNDAQAVVLRGTFDRTGAGPHLEADFQVWDVADPEHPQQWLRTVGEQGEVYVQLEDEAKQLDGVTYAWRVRVLDGAAASAWSDTCHFTVDRSGGPAPTVTSAEYPAGSWGDASGAIGVPGVFALAPVSADAVSYRYRFYSGELSGDPVEGTVNAEGLGGPATVRWSPRAAGHHSLTVRAIDRAGNSSEPAYHEFYVKETRPSVFSAAYQDLSPNLDYNVGVPGAFEFTAARLVGTASFAWRIDEGGPSGTVPADAAGKATVMIAPTRGGWQTLYVHSVAHDGTAHADRAYRFIVDNGPTLTGDTRGSVVIGSSLAFRLAPRMSNVEAYVYWAEYSSLEERPIEKITVPARPDGTADLTWTATETGVAGLRIQSRSADGTLSHPRWQPISVDGAAPTVTRTGGTDLGTPATFTARSGMADVVDYVATLHYDEASSQVVKSAADGTATFSFTPTRSGYKAVTVIARNAAGVRTEQGGVTWTVTDGPRVTSTDFPATGSGRLAPGTFSFTPRMPGSASYQWWVSNGSAAGSGTVAVEADGSAAVTWTPPAADRYVLSVRSFTADRTASMVTTYSFTVEGPPTVSDLKATGGVGSAMLSWTLPSITDLDQVIVRGATGPTAPSSPTAGIAVYGGTGSSATATGLAPGTTYTFAVWVKDGSGKLSAASSVTLVGSTTTIAASATSLAHGSAVTVSGAAVRADTGAGVADAPMRLYGRRKGTSQWTLITTSTTDSSGEVSYSHKPSWGLDYKWLHLGSTTRLGSESSLTTVWVRTTVTATLSKTSVSLGGSVTLSGSVSPAHPGRTVRLERHVDGSWSTVSSTELSWTGAYSFTIQPSAKGTHHYRVHMPPDIDHLASYSDTRSFEVN